MEFKEACQILETRVSPEQILSIDKGNNFYQFVCITGGDVTTYRVYIDGAITVK